MSRKEWGALAVVLVAGLGLQLVGHGGRDAPSGQGHPGHPPTAEAPGESVQSPSVSGAEEGMFRTVALEVRGMT